MINLLEQLNQNQKNLNKPALELKSEILSQKPLLLDTQSFFGFMFDEPEPLFKNENQEAGIFNLEISGIISDYNYRKIKPEIEKAKSFSNLKRLVLHLDSPGGKSDTSTQILGEIESLKEKNPDLEIVSFVNKTAASAAYQISTVSDKIYGNKRAEKALSIGSIGSYILLFDESEYLNKTGIKLEAFASHENKVIGQGLALSAGQKEVLENLVKETTINFFNQVSKSRNLSVEFIKNLNALTFDGEQALEKGLIDGLVTFEDTQNLNTSSTASINLVNNLTSTDTMDNTKTTELETRLNTLDSELVQSKTEISRLKEEAKTLASQNQTLKESLKKKENILSNLLDTKKKEATLAYQAFSGSTLEEGSEVFNKIQSFDTFQQTEDFIKQCKPLGKVAKVQTFTDAAKDGASQIQVSNEDGFEPDLEAFRRGLKPEYRGVN